MINLRSKIPSAPNFRYGEFVKSDTAIRKGISNIPNLTQWNDIEKLAVNILQPLRTHMGQTYSDGRLRITSGFRSVPLCLAVGSSKNSNHARGQASDIEPVDCDIKLFDIIEWIYTNCQFRELIAEYFPDGWVHVAYRERANTRILKLKDKNHNYQRVDINYLRSLYG